MVSPRTLAAVVLLSLAVDGVARGGVVVSLKASVNNNAGTYLYDYILTNQSTNDGNGSYQIFDFLIEVSPDAILENVVTPANWIATYTTGDTQIEWTAIDPASTLASGDSLTFAFTSLSSPGLKTYTALGFDDAFNFGAASASTFAPLAAVPEPATWLNAFAGLALIATRVVYRRVVVSRVGRLSPVVPTR